MQRRQIKKLILIILGISFALQPVLLASQSADPFSILDGIFDEIEYTPTPEDEYYLGRAVAANILSVYEPYTGNPQLTNYLNLICQTLVMNSSRTATYNGYHVMILNSHEFNAFATPGGHIFITKGLIEAVSCEDELAGIIAHELAHIMLGHGIKIIDDMRINEIMDSTARQAAEFAGNSESRILAFRDSINNLFYTMLKNGYSVQQEFEADIVALEILASAGYAPTSFVDLLRLFERNQPRWNEGFGNTHPSPTQRIANVESRAIAYRIPDTRLSRQTRFERIVRN